MIFDLGQEQNIEKMLEHREQRVLFQDKLFNEFPDKTLLSYTLNIPGPIKNNDFILELFNEGLVQIIESLNNNKLDIIYQKEINLLSGNDCFMILDGSAIDIKKQMILLEEGTLVGRLFDLDILTKHQGKITQISRLDLGLTPRTCLICNKEAKICGRSREHSVEELQEKINQIYEEMRNSYGDKH